MAVTHDRRKGAPRIKFDVPLNVHFMAIDGTWCRDCRMIDVSDSGAQLEFDGSVAGVVEFFLVLSASTHPAFRRCKVVWTNGNRMGVHFDKAVLGASLQKRNAAARATHAA